MLFFPTSAFPLPQPLLQPQTPSTGLLNSVAAAQSVAEAIQIGSAGVCGFHMDRCLELAVKWDSQFGKPKEWECWYDGQLEEEIEEVIEENEEEVEEVDDD